jgi:hypothetical protein
MLVRILRWIEGGEELLYTVGGTINYSSHYGSQYRGSSEKLKIPLLGIYLKESKSQHAVEIPAHPCLLCHNS